MKCLSAGVIVLSPQWSLQILLARSDYFWSANQQAKPKKQYVKVSIFRDSDSKHLYSNIITAMSYKRLSVFDHLYEL